MQRVVRTAVGELGEDARTPVERASASGTFAVRLHAGATLLFLDGWQQDFRSAVEDARRSVLAVDNVEGEDADR